MKIANIEELRKAVSNLPMISRDKVTILYVNDKLDSPIEGMCEFDGEPHYFVWTGEMDEKSDSIIRRFVLIKLNKKQTDQEKEEYDNFKRLRELNNLNQFYEARKTYPALKVDADQLVGYFND